MPLPASQISPDLGQQFAAMPSYPNGSLHAGLYTLVFRIRRKSDRTLLREHKLVLMPQRFNQTTESRTSVYYTQGGPVADTIQDGGIGITYFSIQGHTGFWGIRSDLQRRPVAERLSLPATPEVFADVAQTLFNTFQGGGSLPLQTSLIDGAAAFKDLQDTVWAYFDPLSAASFIDLPTPQQDLQLEFLNLMAPTSQRDQVGNVGWIVHPHRNLVDLQQDASKPFLFQYSFNFAALAMTDEEIPDPYLAALTDPPTGLQASLRQLTQAVRDLTNGVNTIEDAFTQMTIQQFTGPVSTFLEETQNLGNAVGNFISSGADKIRFPLYAQRTLSHVLDAPRHSVTTLAEASRQLAEFLIVAADPRSIGRTLAGETLTGGADDELTVGLNGEDPVTLLLGTLTGGSTIAAAIQSQVRALTPQAPANASAYRDFSATWDPGTQQYSLASGTKGSDAGRVEVIVNPDTALTPGDASQTLGLGLGNGGQEHAGSAYPNHALALLRGVEQACTHLQGFPEYFADQLDAQDAALAALLPPGVTRPQIRGDQRLTQTRVTPGDTLQGIAARVRVDWQTLAVVNRLTYPFILESPTTLTRGRVSSADYWTLSDVVQTWPVDAWQGQRLVIVSGIGAGQNRRILRNTATQLVVEHAWDVVPEDISNYAIQSADNPIQRTGTVTSATTTTLTNGALALVPESQMGLTLVLTSGATAGERRQVVQNDATTYTLDRPWTVLPAAGTLYLLMGPGPATRRQLVVGDWLSVPRPSAQSLLPIRGRLQDVSAITGRQKTVEEQLFGKDVLNSNGSLVYDEAAGDAVTIAGLPNLRQAMIAYINLPLGELEYFPSIGSYVQEELGLTATLPLQIQLLSSLQRTIKQDNRISSMDGATLLTRGGQTLIAFGATAINGSTLDRVVVR
jgi:hypothetical protein